MPNVIIRFDKRQNDIICDGPCSSPTKAFLLGIMTQPPHKTPNPPLWDLDVDGALFSPETMAELDKRGFDMAKARVILPMKTPQES
jgi:hypothetical protein